MCMHVHTHRNRNRMNSISCKASGHILMNTDTWQGCQAKKIICLKARVFHVSLLIIAFAMIIMVMTAWRGQIAAVIIIICWRMYQANRSMGKNETEARNWMTDWNVRKKPRMCGNSKVAVTSLDHEAWLKEDFDTKRSCPECLRKARCWQTDWSGI